MEQNQLETAPSIPEIPVEKALNMRENKDGSPIGPQQRERITDAYCGATQALRDNNGVQADLTANLVVGRLQELNRVPLWKRAIQVAGVLGVFGVGFFTSKAVYGKKNADTNSVHAE